MNNIEKERKLEKQKNELITNVSHDLRTPLTSIIDYLRLLEILNMKIKNNMMNIRELLLRSQSSSLKTERNKQRETSIFILDARQTNFIGEFDPGSG